MSTIATKISVFLLLFCVPFSYLNADAVSMQGGLSQLFLNGWNVAGTYYGKRIVFEYSHGSDLHFDAMGGAGLNDSERKQNLTVHLPYTTGFGIGFLLTPNFDVRLEVKEHFYRVRSETTPDELYLFQSLGLRTDLPIVGNGTENWLPPLSSSENFIDLTVRKSIEAELLYGAHYVLPGTAHRYRTRSVGLGMYYRFFPLGGQEGLMIEPSLRFWPNVWTDSPGKVAFENQYGILGLHKAHEQGLFANVSVGYYKKLE
ncbi:hypothetical protein CH379_014120 [Leptospira ellisii]|uniref:Outer membrane protein beta-barrel domain-containing protein n=3 Tax=Leptospira ellisii TaxID=2023197 RepID=A0A2N0B935_9LEPT|nr:hypothetical protein [Leptospira ellisii]MDV6236760.1 hypothetical protein [Leptospira ellisii]PJZ93060.1 hypothetical protein CH379_09805 [Leptospira ellisii]